MKKVYLLFLLFLPFLSQGQYSESIATARPGAANGAGTVGIGDFFLNNWMYLIYDYIVNLVLFIYYNQLFAKQRLFRSGIVFSKPFYLLV